MDPELQKQLAAYLKAILDTAQSGAAFVQEQAPLVVQEKIMYGRVTETLLLLLMVAVMGVALRAVWRKRPEWERNTHSDEGGFPTVIISLVTGICLVVSYMQAEEVALVWFAPRLYILEWAVQLSKQVG